MHRRLQEIAMRLVELPDWLVVTGVAIVADGQETSVPLPIQPGEGLPIPDGSFTLRIDVEVGLGM